MKQAQKQEEGSVNAFAAAAKTAAALGNNKDRDSICDIGINSCYSMMVRESSGGAGIDIARRFEVMASTYREIAELHGIKGESGLKRVCIRHAKLAESMLMALAMAKRCTE